MTGTLGDVLEDVVTLEVQTYIGEHGALETGGAQARERLLASTRCKLDGDIKQTFYPSDDEQIVRLIALHEETVSQAQAYRMDLLKMLLSVARPGL